MAESSALDLWSAAGEESDGACAQTIRALAATADSLSDFSPGGLVKPVPTASGGVLTTPSCHTAALDLGAIATGEPAAVVFHGVVQRSLIARATAEATANALELPILYVGDMIAHRRRTEYHFVLEDAGFCSTRFGNFHFLQIRASLEPLKLIVLIKGAPEIDPQPLVRIHSECLTGDALGSLRCDCGSQLSHALESIQNEGSGVLIYVLGHEGRGIGLVDKLRAYNLQDQGRDTVEANMALGHPADNRNYATVAQVLRMIGCEEIRLITNNPEKVFELNYYGINIREAVRVPAMTTDENHRYLLTKRALLGHSIIVQELACRPTG